MVTDYLIIGRVVKPFGVKGEVKVQPITDRLERFHDLSYVFIKKGEAFKKVEIESVRLHGSHVCLKPAACSTRDDAGSMAGELLYIDREHAAPIDEKSHYFYDLAGCSVRTTEGRLLGVLHNIQNAGSCDVYIVRTGTENGKSGEILIPAISEVVKKIDVKAKEIIIDPIDGLL